MKKVGILYICTGKYSLLWKEFFESYEKFFLPSCEKHYFVFTDADSIEYEKECDRIHRYYQEAEPWPFPTLYRYKYFLKIENDLKRMDYLFFFNADCEALREMTEEMVLPRLERKEELVVVAHSGYYKCHPYDFAYDRNPRSTAFIPYWRGKNYVCGGLNGGFTSSYLRMCHIIDANVDRDYKKGIIALWHDESHLNKYILKHRHYRLLPPNYSVNSQPWCVVDGEKNIFLRDKNKYFDLLKVKDYDPPDMTPPFFKKINRLEYRVLKKLFHRKKVKLKYD